MHSQKHRNKIVVLAECYANECVARKLLQELRKSIECSIRVKHSYKQGRDRILRELMDTSSVGCIRIALIDYERGVSRIYIDKNFELEKVDSKILVGVAKREPHVIAIVFDPDIEEALLCRFLGELCRDSFLYQKVKSRKACSVISRVIERDEVKEILRAIISKVLDIMNKINPL